MRHAVFLFVWGLLFLPSAASAEWLRAESRNFVVYSEGDEGRLRGRVLQLEEFDRLLRRLTGTEAAPAPARLPVYFVRGYGQLAQIREAGAGTAGFYDASPDGMVAVIDHGWRQDYMTHDEVLLHEYAHHFMLQYFPAAYPVWYVEGFAEYVATARFLDDSIEIGRYNEIRASWLADRSGWLPFDRLLFSDPARLSGVETAKFYAQSWLLVHYLLRDTDRRRRLAAYLTAVGRGEEPRAAFAAAFDTTGSAMQRDASRYAAGTMSFTRVPRLTAAEAPEVRVTRLEGLPDALLLAQAAGRVTRHADAERFLARVRGIAGGRDEPVARRLLARAEALYGDGAAADRLLDPLIAAAPGDVELLYLKGMRHLVAGRRDEAGRAAHFSEAQRWFVRAHRADPDHFPTLYRYAESLTLEPSFLSNNTMNVLRLAHQLAPQVPEIALSAANLQLRRGEFGEAEAMLAPLAANRHRGAMARTARALIEKARARDASGLPGVFDRPAEE